MDITVLPNNNHPQKFLQLDVGMLPATHGMFQVGAAMSGQRHWHNRVYSQREQRDLGDYRGGQGDHRGGQGDHRGGQGDHRGGQGDHRGGQGDHRGGQGDHRGGQGDHRGGQGDHRGGQGDHRGGQGDHRGGQGDHRGGQGDHRGGQGDHRGGQGDHRGGQGDHRGGQGDHRGGQGDHRGGQGDHRGGQGDHRGGQGDHRGGQGERMSPPSPGDSPVEFMDRYLEQHITSVTFKPNIKRNPLFVDIRTADAGQTRKGPSWTIQEYDRQSDHNNLASYMKEEEKTAKDLDFWLEDLYTPGYDSLLKKKEAELRRRKVCKVLSWVILSVCVIIVIITVPIMVTKNNN